MDIRVKRLIEAMNLREISQVELSEKTGITKGAISSYVSGRYFPKQENLYLISKALNVDPSFLMGLDVDLNGKELKLAQEQSDEEKEIEALKEELHKNPELRILMSTSKNVTKESLQALINIAQNMKEKD